MNRTLLPTAAALAVTLLVAASMPVQGVLHDGTTAGCSAGQFKPYQKTTGTLLACRGFGSGASWSWLTASAGGSSGCAVATAPAQTWGACTSVTQTFTGGIISRSTCIAQFGGFELGDRDCYKLQYSGTASADAMTNGNAQLSNSHSGVEDTCNWSATLTTGTKSCSMSDIHYAWHGPDSTYNSIGSRIGSGLGVNVPVCHGTTSYVAVENPTFAGVPILGDQVDHSQTFTTCFKYTNHGHVGGDGF